VNPTRQHPRTPALQRPPRLGAAPAATGYDDATAPDDATMPDDATVHFIVACRSSALVLNREGRPVAARELWDLADQVEQAMQADQAGQAGQAKEYRSSRTDSALDRSVLGQCGPGRDALVEAEPARRLDILRPEVAAWPAP